MCALFSHQEKLVPKTPRQANSQTKDLICTCSAHLRVFLGGWGKEILNQWIWMVKHVEFAPFLTGMPWRPRHGVRMADLLY